MNLLTVELTAIVRRSLGLCTTSTFFYRKCTHTATGATHTAPPAPHTLAERLQRDASTNADAIASPRSWRSLCCDAVSAARRSTTAIAARNAAAVVVVGGGGAAVARNCALRRVGE